MKTLSTCLLVAISVLGLASLAAAQQAPRLNEIVRNDVSTDDREFVEICAQPGTSLADYWIIEIEGETAKGNIDKAIRLTGTVGASGLYTIGMPLIACADQSDPLTIENGGVTILLVQGFTGQVNLDIDTNDDCVADIIPFPGTIVDGVGMGLPSAGDCFTYYGVPGFGPDTGSGGTGDFDPAGVARCLDCTGTWGMICLEGTEGTPFCFASNPQGLYNVDAASPCVRNLCGVVPVETTTWGAIKNTYK